ncbi:MULTISPECIES: Na+/H+ antiporter NhaC [Chromohalobacter]|uniref:Malate + proton/lactate + sodium antiporter, NhaC family n=1 Tax=Chromohalobacter israelensis (strain ATCC BAA-138 / DSM 3043 / CIP 106854 / NCIMB 13768 / 1H11) TaxID=290398 RepID=Q1QU02_CHRI1|nr:MULTISPECIES: Na+/H+ antiporter NhaC [Chromohalobacter]ABE60056.1 malate + proton/lactate + sodium antiporter, NhaC family [Chromohalobacter salexigens DSM 3043]NQY45013.1 Na+/H+ antiporter NhaC [Chromohalobacter sp.]NWO56232.1 Na+/H+ antiporter NhaC [Chromohalobacter salexigens]PWW42422.1 malate + proton/lactate + sodium antiporter (NhaC family) [Chromohalobacter salexigens]
MSSPQGPTRLPGMMEVLAVMVGFIAIMFLSINVLGLPIQLALFASWFLVMALGLKLKMAYADMQRGLIDGIHNGMEAVLVLTTVGALIGTWIAGGIVPSIIYYGLTVMNPQIFLFAAFVICALTSLSTGTSFGTAGTAGVAMMGIGHSFGIPLPLVAGAVISGAYVGDKMSPLSDTTVMTASLCKVNLIDHIRSMMTVSALAIPIASILFLIVGFFYVSGDVDTSRATVAMQALEANFTISPWLLLPAAIVIGLLTRRYPAIPVITFGAVLGSICAWWAQGVGPIDAIRIAYVGNAMQSDVEFLNTLLNRGGIESMLGVVALILFALGLGGLMSQVGILKAISNGFLRWANNPGRLTVSTMLGGFFGNFFGGAAYVSLITASTITEKNYDDQGVDRRVLSRNAEAGGTITTPMVPWTDGGVFMATTLGVSTMAYLPFLWYHMLVIAITILYGYANIAIWRTQPKADGQDNANPRQNFQAS